MNMHDELELIDPFEVFAQGDIIKPADWDLLVRKISSYCSKFTIEISFNSNVIEIFVYCSKDLSTLSNKIEGFLLSPSVKREIGRNDLGRKIYFNFSPKKSITELIETEELKRDRKITNIYIHFDKKFVLNIYSLLFLFENKIGDKYYSEHIMFTNPLLGFEFNFRDSNSIKKKSFPLSLKFDDALELFRQEQKDSLLEVFGFPYFSDTHYVGLDSFDFDKHSLIVGQTGVGKSKFIELFVKCIQEKENADDYSIVIIDPHSSLFQQSQNLRLPYKTFDFVKNYCEVFPSFSDPKIATELTILLFKTLLAEQFNAKMERTLKYVLFTLFSTNNMSVKNMKNFLIDLDFRKRVLTNIKSTSSHVVQFFDTEYLEMQTKYYEIAIMPLLVLIDELEFLPVFANKSSENLEESLKNNFLTTFSLDRIYLGDKATKLIAGLIIQQLFLIAQKRSLNKKLILIIDEVSTIENESLIHILSEARKFNLSLFLSQQYLTQITPDLLRGILSNVYNYFVFKVSDGDAEIVSKNLDISFSDDVLLSEKKKGISEEDLKRNILVNLNPRECMVRFFGNGRFYPSFKAKTLNI